MSMEVNSYLNGDKICLDSLIHYFMVL